MSARTILLLLFTLRNCMIHSQYSLLSGSYDLRAAGTGKAGVAQRDPDNFINNPAHLGIIRHSGAYGQWLGHYLTRELSAGQIQIMLKTKVPGCLGLSLHTDGGTDFRESLLGIAYGRALAHSGYAGMGLQLYTESLPESGTSIGIVPVIGTQWNVIPKVTVGTSIVNPLPLGTAITGIPAVFRFGACYEINLKLFLSGEMQMNGWSGRDLRTGFEYRPSERISIRTGYSGKGIISLGLTYTLNGLGISTAWQFHPDLGSNAGVGLTWRFAPGGN